VDLSQEHPDQPRSMLAVAISAIRDGDLSQTQVARLSDLSRNNARVLAVGVDTRRKSY
jgi:predicted HTH domain antitoxin